MVFTHNASIPLALSAIHLDEWLFNLSEADYKACARGHRAVGTNGGSEFKGMVNVESMAGALLVQHYRTDLFEASHVRLYSARSRGYLMHVIPFRWGSASPGLAFLHLNRKLLSLPSASTRSCLSMTACMRFRPPSPRLPDRRCTAACNGTASAACRQAFSEEEVQGLSDRLFPYRPRRGTHRRG